MTEFVSHSDRNENENVQKITFEIHAEQDPFVAWKNATLTLLTGVLPGLRQRLLFAFM